MNKTQKALVLLTLSLTMLSACVSTPLPNEEESFTIGVIQLVTHPALDATLEGLKDQLETEGKSSSITLIVQNTQGDPNVANTIAQQFVSDGVDLIYAIATPAAQAALNATLNTSIPVVFNAVSAPVSAGLVASLESSGNNVTGMSNAVVIGVTNLSEVAAAMGQLLPQVDAVFNVTDNLVASATSQIVDLAKQANKPVFGSDPTLLPQGLLAVDGVDFFALGQSAALQVIDILFNEQLPSDIPVGTPTSTRLFVNQEMAQELGITFPQSVLDRLNE